MNPYEVTVFEDSGLRVSFDTNLNLYYPMFKKKTGLFKYVWYYFRDRDNKWAIYFHDKESAVQYLKKSYYYMDK